MHRMGYRESIRWLLANDDCAWLDDEYGYGNSVASSLVADIFNKTDDEVKAALLRERSKQQAKAAR